MNSNPFKQLGITERSVQNRQSQQDREINSEFIFQHKELKKKTKGYDKITGEIDKRGKPKEQMIFIKDPNDEPSEKEKLASRKKKEKERLTAMNKKLYKDRLKSKWDRSW